MITGEREAEKMLSLPVVDQFEEESNRMDRIDKIKGRLQE
jgi:hypothetical protein